MGSLINIKHTWQFSISGIVVLQLVPIFEKYVGHDWEDPPFISPLKTPHEF